MEEGRGGQTQKIARGDSPFSGTSPASIQLQTVWMPQRRLRKELW